MGAFAEYEQYDGVGLANLIRNGEIKAVDVREEAISRAEALNPNINAIITPLYEYARKASEVLPVNGSFSGVPFLLKDAHHALKGATLSYGSALLKQNVAEIDENHQAIDSDF